MSAHENERPHLDPTPEPGLKYGDLLEAVREAAATIEAQAKTIEALTKTPADLRALKHARALDAVLLFMTACVAELPKHKALILKWRGQNAQR